MTESCVPQNVKKSTVFGVIAVICMIATWLLGAGIYLFTLYLAYLTSFFSLLLTLTFPVIGQLVWIWILWGATGVFFNLLTLLCIAWIVLLGITMFIASKAEA
jgi:hypothetical protein